MRTQARREGAGDAFGERRAERPALPVSGAAGVYVPVPAAPRSGALATAALGA